jgi:hypothetical protein
MRRHASKSDADRARVGWDRPLALGANHPAARARLQPPEFRTAHPSGEANDLDIQPKLAACFVDRGDGTHSTAPVPPKSTNWALAKNTQRTCARVLQVEIAVARSGSREVGDLAGDPEQAQVAFENEPRGAHKERHGDHRWHAGGWILGDFREAPRTAGRIAHVEDRWHRSWSSVVVCLTTRAQQGVCPGHINDQDRDAH